MAVNNPYIYCSAHICQAPELLHKPVPFHQLFYPNKPYVKILLHVSRQHDKDFDDTPLTSEVLQLEKDPISETHPEGLLLSITSLPTILGWVAPQKQILRQILIQLVC